MVFSKKKEKEIRKIFEEFKLTEDNNGRTNPKMYQNIVDNNWMDFFIMNLTEITGISFTELYDETDMTNVWRMYAVKCIQGKINTFWVEMGKKQAKMKGRK